MGNDINIELVYNYWLTSAENDFNTMGHLHHSKDYSWALFIGHLVIEKLLKATIVKETGEHAPFTHDLTKLAQLTKLDWSENQLDQLDTITTFNLNTRYDSYKQDFFKKCSADYTLLWISVINEIRLWIKERH